MPPSKASATRQALKTRRSTSSRTLIQPSVPGAAFLALCLLVALGVTRPLDWWGQSLLTSLSSSLFDVTGLLLSLLGAAPITGALAVGLAMHGRQRRREYGLRPLLLFVGVGIEVFLKAVLPHPGPGATFVHHLSLPAWLRLSSSLFTRVAAPPVLRSVAPPYSFPSGHMLRTTFLVAVTREQQRQWRLAGWGLVGAMAVTRIYCNEHWLSDVVGGALLGWSLAGVATML
jgi:membrane-associated phospholipid phosphatase